MIDLNNLEPIGRKQWAKRKWDAYEASEVAKAIKRSTETYEDPTNCKFCEVLNKSKWRSTVDKKVNYLLARPPVCKEAQEKLDDLSMLLRETATQYYLRGSLIWIVQGDGTQLEPVPMIMEDTIAVYGDEHKETPIAFIRKYIDLEADAMTGEETTVEYFELYYGNTRDTFCYTKDDADKTEQFEEAPMFIQLARTGDAPLFAYVEGLVKALNNLMKHQDTTTEKNTDPLIEVRGYSGTAEEDLEYVLKNSRIAKTDGNGGVTVHTLSMDSNSMELWAKRILQEYYEATCTVGKENELAYAQSGKAMDRLFVDMENDARKLAAVLEQALGTYFEKLGIVGADIVWNTDRPIDDDSIISAIAQSQGLLSNETLLEQHPWVDDVEEEKRRLEEQASRGFEGLMEGAEDNGIE